MSIDTHPLGYFDGSPILSEKILGYLPNLVGDRIAIILVTVSRGWEGPPHVSTTEFIGADLEKGFTMPPSGQKVEK